MPAQRAALFSIRPTIGLLSREGICPIRYGCCDQFFLRLTKVSSLNFDTPGVMGLTTYDVALLLEVMAENDASNSFGMILHDVPWIN